MDVIHEAVTVIVLTIAFYFPRVAPRHRSQVNMEQRSPRIKHSDNKAGVTRGYVPRFKNVDVGVRRSARLTNVHQRPLI